MYTSMMYTPKKKKKTTAVQVTNLHPGASSRAFLGLLEWTTQSRQSISGGEKKVFEPGQCKKKKKEENRKNIFFDLEKKKETVPACMLSTQNVLMLGGFSPENRGFSGTVSVLAVCCRNR